MGKFVADSIFIDENDYHLTLCFSKVEPLLKDNVEKILDTEYEIIEV